MILQEPDKMRARIHMGVPVLGVQDSGFALGYRFTNVMGLFENRMNTLQPHEYARITGTPTAAMQIQVNNGKPNVGDTLSVTVSGQAAVVYTVTATDLLAADPVLSATTNFANKVNATIGTVVIATQQPSVVFPTTTIGVGPQAWQCAFAGTSSSTFTITCAGTGNLTAFPILQGALPYPTQTFQEDGTTATGYLAICDYLESKISSASDLMKFSTADVVSFRPDEMRARSALYTFWRKRLAAVFGIPLNPMAPVGRFGGSGTGLTV